MKPTWIEKRAISLHYAFFAIYYAAALFLVLVFRGQRGVKRFVIRTLANERRLYKEIMLQLDDAKLREALAEIEEARCLGVGQV